MTIIKADAMLKSRLNGLNEHLEIYDEHSVPIGHFLRQAMYEDLFYSALALETGHTKEELRRRHQESGGRRLAEIRARLD